VLCGDTRYVEGDAVHTRPVTAEDAGAEPVTMLDL